jgi:hypothetical protein
MKLLASFFKTNDFDAHKADAELTKYLVDDESVDAAFKMSGGYVAVTGRRLIVVHKTGVSGSRDYQSVPYGRIGTFTATPKGGFSLGGGMAELRIKVQGQTDDVVLEFADNDTFISVQRGLVALTCPIV